MRVPSQAAPLPNGRTFTEMKLIASTGTNRGQGGLLKTYAGGNEVCVHVTPFCVFQERISAFWTRLHMRRKLLEGYVTTCSEESPLPSREKGLKLRAGRDGDFHLTA